MQLLNYMIILNNSILYFDIEFLQSTIENDTKQYTTQFQSSVGH